MMLFQLKLDWSVLGQSVDSGCLALLRKQKTKRIDWDRPLPLRCLSQFLPVEEKINCLGNVFLFICLRTFHLWGGLIFIMNDNDNLPNWSMILNSMFPSWKMIQYFSH